ncbi:MAG: hypothetical protein ACHP65_09250 [Legionellales bacterium]
MKDKYKKQLFWYGLGKKIRHLMTNAFTQIVIFGLIAVLLYYLSNGEIACKDDIYWLMITADATIALALIALFQLSKMHKTAVADFTHRFKNDFFNKRTRNLFMLFENNLIEFNCTHVRSKDGENEVEIGYFEIPSQKLIRNPLIIDFLEKHDSRYATYEIDDCLLGHFEDLGIFQAEHNLTIEVIYDEFSYYVETIYDNFEIKEYLAWARNGNDDIYEMFDFIYHELQKYQTRKSKHPFLCALLAS